MEKDVVFSTEGLCVATVAPAPYSREIVSDICLELRRGEILSLIGESGSGKTTIALSAMGYCKPGLRFSGGKAVLLGMDVSAMTPQALRSVRGNKVTYMAQSAAATFNPALTIGYQVTETARVHGKMGSVEAHERSLSLFRALQLSNPEMIGNRYPHQVSGGQLQRLMAAMALCGEPDLIVLDEPTTALDVTTQIEVLTAIKSVIAGKNVAAMYVTHDLSVVAQVATRVAVVYEGKVVENGNVEDIIRGGQHPYTNQLIDAAAKNRKGKAGRRYPGERHKSPAVLRVENVSAGYGPMIALHNVELTVRRGETVAIIGESGCGKSTLARVIAGLHSATSGRVILGVDELPERANRRTKQQLGRIQFVHQMADTALNPHQTIGTILGRPLTFYHDLKGPEREKRVEELLEMVELPTDFVGRNSRELSGGQKQRVNLARALAAEPEIILCDEVISALDSIVAANIVSLLAKLQKKTGVALIFITHDLSAAAAISDDTVVLYNGRVVESGPTTCVLSPPYHPYTRLLVSSVPELNVGWLDKIVSTREVAVSIANDVANESKGCSYFSRCPIAIDAECRNMPPPRRQSEEQIEHNILCWHRFDVLG